MEEELIRVEVLRESVRMRAEQTAPGAFALFGMLVVLALLLRSEVPGERLLAWFLPLGAAMAARVALARSILPRLAAAGEAEVRRADRRFFLSSVANQALCGAGIWIVGSGAPDLVAFFITLTIALFGVGAMINLTSDFRSFRASIPLLMGQPVVFWAFAPADGVGIALSFAALSALMLTLVRDSSRALGDSVRMRFEKNALLERVEREREATAAALKLAQDAMRTRAVFLAAASHDLRQPLYAISLLADALAGEPLPGRALGVVEKQRQAIDALRALFDNLLDLSRFEAGEVRCSPRDVPLLETLAAPCNESEVLCRAKGLEWRACLPALHVRTDPELLRRMVSNLLSNAVRYTARGRVELSAVPAGDRLAMTITDTGIGIAQADQERVFEEFVQLHNPARAREQGTGLGLAIVKRIADLVGTRLRLVSTPGEGTSISFDVPLAPAPEAWQDRLPVEGVARDFAGSRVWIVEDDALVRAALEAQLASWGVRPAFADDRGGIVALRRQSDWPDALILDDMLGGAESGLEIARWIAASMPAHRILIQTGNVNADRVAELERSGFVVLTKPVASEDLAQWLSEALGRRATA